MAEQASIYQLKISLDRLKPAIWRRVEVPGSLTLDKLHGVIQVAMGWEDYHLWSFHIGDTEYMPAADGGFLFDFGPKPENPKRVTLDQAVGGHKIKFRYVYDMGDDWLHTIKVEKVIALEAGVTYPRCTAGEHACPPEDCGGPWGYVHLLEVLDDPAHEEHEEMLEWLGGEFDPEAFDLDPVNRRLQPKPRKSKAK